MDTSPTEADRSHLVRAAALGRRGWGRVHPNPMVGCVLVREGEVVGEGWHREFGGPHAEVDALRSAGEAARGATAYVSLEPCRHHGRTPPCTRALLEAGIERVVYGAADPGAESGGGGRELARNGVEVVGPVFSDRVARRENPVFFHGQAHRPWLALKLAVSLDGGIAEAPGTRTVVSGSEASEEVHRLRAGFDAIMVGAGTARTDDPLLTPRGAVTPRVPPARVVVDGRATVEPTARLFSEGKGPVHVITTPAAPPERVAALEAAAARVHEVEPAVTGDAAEEAGRVSLPAALAELRREGMTSVLCEGGGRLATSLLSDGLVDRIVLVLAPRFLGPGRVPAFGTVDPAGSGSWALAEPPRVLGRDTWITLDRED